MKARSRHQQSIVSPGQAIKGFMAWPISILSELIDNCMKQLRRTLNFFRKRSYVGGQTSSRSNCTCKWELELTKKDVKQLKKALKPIADRKDSELTRQDLARVRKALRTLKWKPTIEVQIPHPSTPKCESTIYVFEQKVEHPKTTTINS